MTGLPECRAPSVRSRISTPDQFASSSGIVASCSATLSYARTSLDVAREHPGTCPVSRTIAPALRANHSVCGLLPTQNRLICSKVPNSAQLRVLNFLGFLPISTGRAN